MRPLTIAQKNAIISKIKTKIAEAEDKRYNDFKKNYKFTSKEDKAFIAAIKTFNSSREAMIEANKELKKWNADKYIPSYSFPEGEAERIIIDGVFSKIARPTYPNPEDVATDLEILSIDPAFDAQAFIDKYTQF